MTVNEKLKLYFDYQNTKDKINKRIQTLQDEKKYIMDTLQAMQLSDLPKSHSMNDRIAQIMVKTENIDCLILDGLELLAEVEMVKSECEKLIEPLTETERIILENRLFGKTWESISNICNYNIDYCKQEIKDKIKKKITDIYF